VARSDRRRLRGVAATVGALVVALPLSGCTTTQHEAQRVQLESARQRAALASTRVTVSNPVVTLTSISDVSARGRTAFVVTVRNRTRKGVTDLPISVGYVRPDGKSVYLNAGTNLNYFQAHLPAITAGGSLTWVYTVNRVLPPRTRPFARVGRKPSAPARITETNVRIEVRHAYVSGADTLTVRLANPTSVPQFQLQVYAYIRRGDQFVAAGNATVWDLGAGSGQRVKLVLVGTAGSGLRVKAVPTILQ
jgi:hypothetical protein